MAPPKHQLFLSGKLPVFSKQTAHSKMWYSANGTEMDSIFCQAKQLGCSSFPYSIHLFNSIYHFKKLRYPLISASEPGVS